MLSNSDFSARLIHCKTSDRMNNVAFLTWFSDKSVGDMKNAWNSRKYWGKSTKINKSRNDKEEKRQNNFKRFVIRRSCELKSATNSSDDWTLKNRVTETVLNLSHMNMTRPNWYVSFVPLTNELMNMSLKNRFRSPTVDIFCMKLNLQSRTNWFACPTLFLSFSLGMKKSRPEMECKRKPGE